MEAQSVPLLVALAAGVLSFLSPCVLPLVPSYVTFVTGMSLDELTSETAERDQVRRTVMIHSVLFILGFTFVFVVMGASATFLGSLFRYASRWVEMIGGGLLIIFGLYLIGLLRIPGASREWRVHLADKPTGYMGTVLVGITFGAGWTPCIGPALAAILTLAANSDSLAQGVGLLLVYSAGLAIPFLIAALLLSRFLGRMRSIGPWLPWLSRLSGALLLVVGLLMLTGQFTILTALLSQWTPKWILERL